jgi:cardiolipin synthase C
MKKSCSKIFIAFLFAFALVACASKGYTFRPDASDYVREKSFALSDKDNDTALRHALDPYAKANPGKSGFRILENGEESLDMRLGLIQAAEKTLDLQYYAMHDDTTSNILLEAILRAAARGVRVRFLIDYVALDEVGKTLALLDHNKNIQIRIFNPAVTANQTPFLKWVWATVDLGQAVKRMHNKAIIADNRVVIIGGRNLGDEYFDAHDDISFKDLDVLVAGPVTGRISQNFDDYWNGDNAFPLAVLEQPQTDPGEIAKLRNEIKKNWDEQQATPEGQKRLREQLPARLKAGTIKMVWASVSLALDEPEKLDDLPKDAESKPLSYLAYLLARSNSEFIIVSPYFVPQQEGIDWLAGLVKRGIKVKVLTNSLGSTDVVAVHTGYRRYREAILKAGIELYEQKAIDGTRPEQRVTATTAPPYASLHSKAYIIDREHAMIGSFNFDPRSIELNTELALIVHSHELSGQLLQLFNESITPENSYHVMLDKDGDLIWETEEKGRLKRYHHEPKAGIWRPIQVLFMSFLPIEDQL